MHSIIDCDNRFGRSVRPPPTIEGGKMTPLVDCGPPAPTGIATAGAR
ncbi:hypothetical protein NY08_2945 [Rhodococcus sp. B7740]|nr:hypothetical protein NY08_2945 [Rhodococcus sp. B7740]